jgi:hypothetical protein
MNTNLRPLAGTLAVTFVLAAVSGCGGGKTLARGKLVSNGQPVTVSDKGVIVIRFYAETDRTKGQPFPAETRPDGTFTVVGRDRHGIPPGKYLVSVEAFDPYPRHDKLGGKYRPDATPLTAEVGKGDVTLEVGR